jgi:hypothetical protein
MNKATTNYPTRESWLQAAVTHLRAIFAANKFLVPDCQVSCGFTSTGVRSGHIGQCWSKKSAANEVNQIYISPTLSSAFEVIDTLTHELVHAVDDCQHKHGKEFKKIALKMGLQGPMRSAGAGPELKAKLNALLEQLGPYPHGHLKVSMQKAPRVNRPRARCAQCGYQVPMLKKYLSYGPPLCPKHKTDMEPLGDWE